jgi:hypothetical protein
MITTVDVGEIQRSSDFKENSFRFAASAKGFKIITSKLYENPAFSVIQELSANAYDAHVQAGHPDKPFEVHLPTRIEPYFSIRDFGVSMNPEFMENKYTLVFYSSKTQSNDCNGAWGLGRLTGLACSDTYLVITFIDGKKRTYNVFLNEEGLPACAHINTEDTTEANGVEVNIPVADNKASEFIKYATDIYRNYSIKPVFKGYTPHLPEYKFILKGDGWAYEGSHSQAKAVMGVYHYPINFNSVPELTTKQKQILQAGIFFYFNIGDLDVTASRDGLSYEDKTNKAIKVSLGKLMAEYDVKIQAEFDKCKTLPEAMQLYYSFYHSYGARTKEGKLTSDNFTPLWNGIKVTNWKVDFTVSGVTLERVEAGYGGVTSRISKYREYSVDFHQRVPTFYINDMVGQPGERRRIRSLLIDPVDFSRKHINSLSFFYLVTFATDADKDAFYAKVNFSHFDVKKVSEIPEPPKPIKAATSGTRVYNKKNFKKVFLFNAVNAPTYSSNPSMAWDIAEADLENGSGIYVILDRYYAEGKNRTPHDINTFITQLKSIDPTIGDIKLYGIKVSQKANIGANWIPLATWAQAIIDKALSTVDLKGACNHAANFHEARHNRLCKIVMDYPNLFPGLKPDGVFGKFAEKIKITMAGKELHDKYYNTYRQFMTPYNETDNPNVIDWTKECDVVMKQYPLLNWCINNSYYYSDQDLIKGIADYVTCKDK